MGGEVQYGRQALLKGSNETALGYFYSAAQKDPNYVYATGSSPKAGCLELCRTIGVSYRQISPSPANLGTGAFRKREEDIARLYLGLTLAREGNQQRGLKEIEDGMRGINNFLDYINQAQRYSIGQYWDPGRDIRSAIQVTWR